MFVSVTSVLAVVSSLAAINAAPLDLFHHKSNHTTSVSTEAHHTHTHNHTHTLSSTSSSAHPTHSTHSLNITLPSLVVNFTQPSSSHSSAIITHTASATHSVANATATHSHNNEIASIISKVESKVESLFGDHSHTTSSASHSHTQSSSFSVPTSASSSSSSSSASATLAPTARALVDAEADVASLIDANLSL